MGSESNDPKDAPGWVILVGQIGYFAKGIVYITVAILAMLLAIGFRSESQGAGKSQAFDWIGGLVFGRILLFAIGIGVIFYGVWRFIESIYDPANIGWGIKGGGKRAGFLVSGTLYILLGIEAIRQGINGDSGGNNSSWIGRIMQRPLGRWIVGVIGGVVVLYGVYNGYRAYSKKFEEKLALDSMAPNAQIWAKRFGTAGYAAYCVTTTLTGIFIMFAAMNSDSSQSTGLSNSLTTILDWPLGPYLLALVAMGLAFYGCMMLVFARYRIVFVQNSDVSTTASPTQASSV